MNLKGNNLWTGKNDGYGRWGDNLHDELFIVFKALNIIIGADSIDGTHKNRSIFWCFCVVGLHYRPVLIPLCLFFQLEQSLRGQGGESLETPSKNLVQQNIELRRKLEDEHASYKRKLQAYQDGQQRQAQLVQKLQAKVHRNSVSTFLIFRYYFSVRF